MEPWSLVAEHPNTGEPFGIVMQDDSTLAEAEYIARQLLSTFNLTGLYVPASAKHERHGHYLFTFIIHPEKISRLGSIWAESLHDAGLRLTVLSTEATLFMPASG